MLMRRLSGLLLAAALVQGCDSPLDTTAPDPAGTWVGLNTGNPLWGDSIRVQLVRTDTVLTGTYTAYGAADGRPDQYSGAAWGRHRAPVTNFGFTYDPRDYGCTGPSSTCNRIYLVFTGTMAGDTRITGTLDDALNQWPAEFTRRD
jgi:hypothetical protein